MVVTWKDNFILSNIWPTFGSPEIFVMSQWQRDKQTPSYLYVLLRVAIFLTFFTIWILSYTMESSSNKPKWPLYLTNWGLTVCTIQSFLSSLMLICAILGTNVLDNSELTQSALKAYKTYWITNSMATTIAFTISFVYWTLIHQPEYWSIMNFMVHGMNAILMIIDFCAVAHPVRFLHFVYPVGLAFVYVTMTAIFYACGGTAKNGDQFIYPILKWSTPGITVAYCIAIMILIFFIHTLTFFLYKGKVKIAELCFGEPESDSFSDTAMQML
ncbi:protein rolling stone isoform X2 [Dendroctonus ponderosae]|nr:protein rolling stone isoform X2 [Dendroctonus ponderosae]KAH1009199.1 hypothetical protein HUJ04_001593 [Dendroctonus ponderosae]KAH1017165.1 hypothetical protein HUJ05_007865 [Dendroctonus ponderosae]